MQGISTSEESKEERREKKKRGIKVIEIIDHIKTQAENHFRAKVINP
jgi:hypothetical protein